VATRYRKTAQAKAARGGYSIQVMAALFALIANSNSAGWNIVVDRFA
jgi:hypothetical protein